MTDRDSVTKARRYERRANSYYGAGMIRQGDRALGMANFYWEQAGKPQMQRVYKGTRLIAIRGRTRDTHPMAGSSFGENPISSTTRDVLVAVVGGGVLAAVVYALSTKSLASTTTTTTTTTGTPSPIDVNGTHGGG